MSSVLFDTFFLSESVTVSLTECFTWNGHTVSVELLRETPSSRLGNSQYT